MKKDSCSIAIALLNSLLKKTYSSSQVQELLGRKIPATNDVIFYCQNNVQVFVPIEVQENVPVMAAEHEDDDSSRCYKSNDVSRSQWLLQVAEINPWPWAVCRHLVVMAVWYGY